MNDYRIVGALRFKKFWVLNEQTGEVYPLGPMYGGTVEYARQKLQHENLPYQWELLAPVMGSERIRA